MAKPGDSPTRRIKPRVLLRIHHIQRSTLWHSTSEIPAIIRSMKPNRAHLRSPTTTPVIIATMYLRLNPPDCGISYFRRFVILIKKRVNA